MKKALSHSEFHVLLFCLGLALVNWPFLSIFQDKPLEDLFTYLFLIWAAAILFLLFISRSCKKTILSLHAKNERKADD